MLNHKQKPHPGQKKRRRKEEEGEREEEEKIPKAILKADLGHMIFIKSQLTKTSMK